MRLAYLREISKYLIVAFGAFYVFAAYAALAFRRHSNSPWLLGVQFLLGVCARAFGYLAMYSASGELNYLFAAAFAEIIIFAGYFLFRMLLPMGDAQLLQDLSMLLGIGLMMVTRLSFGRGMRQIFFTLIAFVFALALPWLYPRMKRISLLPYGIGVLNILLLSLVLVQGAKIHGSKLNFSLMGFTFQPSELAKLLFIFFLAGVYLRKPKLAEFLLIGMICALHVLILVFSRDLGGALIFFVVYSLMTLFYLRRPSVLIPLGAGGCLAAFLAWRLFTHVQVRVRAFLDPWSVIDNEGFQLSQSLFAICSGGVFGLGLLQGNPRDIPYVDTDFVFSAIAEELGLLFGILLLLICLHVFLVSLRIAFHSADMFGRYFAFGLGVCYLFQVLLTVGGGVRFIPLTGVTLPLISYGGSSLITTVLMFGFLYTVSAGKVQPLTDVVRVRIIRAMAVLSGLVITVLSVYTAAYCYQNYQPLLNNNYNGRQRILIRQNTRGRILSGGGEVLAQTVRDAEGNESREYPYGALFAHVVGYNTRGRMGLENDYNYYLITSDISIGKKIALEEAGEKLPADDIYTTLDVKLQEVASRAMGVYQGAAIVSDPKTGAILAMVSKPDFNPGEIPAIWNDLISNKEDSRLVNRASSGLYPPGSTFKILTALEYYRENPDSFRDYRYNCSGRFTAEGSTISCFHGTSHGKVDFFTSFAKSCNSSFANIGHSLDRESFRKTLEQCLFNKDLPGSVSAKSSTVVVDEGISEDEMLQTSIGQGKTQITPLHLNLITQAIANGGSFHAPCLVSRVENAEGKIVRDFTPDKGNAIMSEPEAMLLTEMMTAVVEEGTGKKLSGLSYSAAGKTGSAEYGTNKGDSHAWFTGFAPAEDPELVVTVIIEGAGSGSDHAVPIAKRIFDAYFGVD